MKGPFLLFSLFLLSTLATAQITPPSVDTDTTVQQQTPLIVEKDTTDNIEEIDTYANQFVPRKASLYSAIVPGLGQVYNKRYWKVPLIYGGFIGLGLTVNFFDDQYKEAKSRLFVVLEEGASADPDGLTEDQLRSIIDDTRRERDFYMIMSGVLYLLQIAEAHIDAHLKEFQLNPQLKVSLEPSFEQPSYTTSYSAGFTIKIKF